MSETSEKVEEALIELMETSYAAGGSGGGWEKSIEPAADRVRLAVAEEVERARQELLRDLANLHKQTIEDAQDGTQLGSSLAAMLQVERAEGAAQGRRETIADAPRPPAGLGEAKSWEVVDHLHKWFNERYVPWLTEQAKEGKP